MHFATRIKRTAGLARAAALFALVTFAGGCGHAPFQRPTTPGYSYTAVASWYGPQFNGRRTASGEVFDMEGITAAHKTLPFGTRLKVTYPKTGRSVVVIVNDRGPFVSGRDIDLSRGAASGIGLLPAGVDEVEIEVLGRDVRYVKYVKSGNLGAVPVSYGDGGVYRVQVGAFVDRLNAEHLKRGLELGYEDVHIEVADVDGTTFHRVQVGRVGSLQEADALAERLADEGYETFIAYGR